MSGYLVDSHILVWALDGNDRLTATARHILVNEPDVWVSVASLWELALKQTSGKLTMPDLDDALPLFGIRELPVAWRHVRRTRDLPPLHGDPFDRILVAQALVENLVLVTADRTLSLYPVRTLF